MIKTMGDPDEDDKPYRPPPEPDKASLTLWTAIAIAICVVLGVMLWHSF